MGRLSWGLLSLGGFVFGASVWHSGKICYSVHVLTDEKLISPKENHRCMQLMQVYSTMQSKYIHSKYVLYKLDCVEWNDYFPHKYK